MKNLVDESTKKSVFRALKTLYEPCRVVNLQYLVVFVGDDEKVSNFFPQARFWEKRRAAWRLSATAEFSNIHELCTVPWWTKLLLGKNSSELNSLLRDFSLPSARLGFFSAVHKFDAVQWTESIKLETWENFIAKLSLLRTRFLLFCWLSWATSWIYKLFPFFFRWEWILVLMSEIYSKIPNSRSDSLPLFALFPFFRLLLLRFVRKHELKFCEKTGSRFKWVNGKNLRIKTEPWKGKARLFHNGKLNAHSSSIPTFPSFFGRQLKFQ